MRSRSNSGVRLDYYQRIVTKLILKNQNPVTGLFPHNEENPHAWIRDNVYCILSVWGLSMSYKKMADQDEDHAKNYELDQSCVKLMRGLLMSMMQQKDKVERFKETQNPMDALHAKYSSVTGQTVVGDTEWGHLQIDAISLYLLILAQMTASGLQIVFTLDEVAFVQNLVFYIEGAYCTPDYGIWERGDKTNHGLLELNSSSVGMAKAALEALNELDLFGARGGPYSVIHVLADEAQKCNAVLQSMLPRESSSKEIDSGVLSIIGFPAFALDDTELIKVTRDNIISKLQGKYGCKRFLRDGYKTCKEDPNRLYYEPWELKIFENIECEWPLFFCYLMIEFWFHGDKEESMKYTQLLENVMIRSEERINLVPELYTVSMENVGAEYESPGSQPRIPLGQTPFLWAQSLYILGKLLQDGFLAVGELDPLNRRLSSLKKPDVVVQVVILAEDNDIRDKLAQYDIHVQTIAQVAPIEVQPARVLSYLYTYLGRNTKLGLSGRKSRDVGILCTSKLYSMGDKIFAFTPQFTDMSRNYIASDYELMIDICKSEINFLKSSWHHMLGRPVITLVIRALHLDQGKIPMALITTMKKLKSGYINGTRVTLGNLNDFLSTSCITNLSFLGCHEDGLPDKLNPQVGEYLEEHLMKCFSNKSSLLLVTNPNRRARHVRRRVSVRGLIKRTRSINVVEGEGKNTISIDQVDRTRSPSPININITPPKKELLDVPIVSVGRHRSPSELQYSETDDDELFAMLRESESLDEQGDILQYLVNSKGLDYNTGMLEYGKVITVRDLLKGLYEKACQQKMWGLVRHTAGMLGKRVEDLAKAVTDLLVRQKQITVGMPNNEHTISAPLPESELRTLIHKAYGEDDSTAMLTHELLVYLAMFIRTEPQLFREMLRLRIGLIIQVMATELSRTLICGGDEASEHLLNLSPYDMKNLLHHIISGKEFAISNVGRGNFSIISSKSSRISRKSHIGLDLDCQEDVIEPERQGQWLRRRRLDGALNRVPHDFYPRIWAILEKCQGIDIGGNVLPKSLTEEMTPGELKFALAFETVLNTIPQPEYRQLVVEALMVLTVVSENNVVRFPKGILQIERLVHGANDLFLKDQIEFDGDATLCCAKTKHERELLTHGGLVCNGAAYICQHFYDTAPSGCYGTMTYLIKALIATMEDLPKGGEMDCCVI